LQERTAAHKRASAEKEKLRLELRLGLLQKEATTIEEQRQANKEEFRLKLQAQRAEKELSIQVGSLPQI